VTVAGPPIIGGAADGYGSSMSTLTRATTIACPPERVFAVLSDVDRLPEFSEMTAAVRNGPGRPVQVDDSFDQVVRVLGVELETEWHVVELDPPTLLRFEGTATGGARASLVERLSPEGDGTRVELEVDYDLPLGILGKAIDSAYLQGKNEEQAEEILSRLKELCEGSS
jgi:uncharacterized membrane protein